MTGDNGTPLTPDWDLALVLARQATDTGARHDLDDVIRELGIDPAELRAEEDAERHIRGEN